MTLCNSSPLFQLTLFTRFCASLFSDGRSFGRTTRLQAKIEARQVRQSAALNREMNMNQILIPRTQRLDTRQCQPMDCDTFAAILIDKLERIKKEQEAQELFDRKLKEVRKKKSLKQLKFY